VTGDVWTLLIPVFGAVLVAVIAAAAQVINSRNDRAQAHQEVDLLLKLDPTSDTAKQLFQVLQARVNRWHARFYKTTPVIVGKRRSGGVNRWLILLIVIVYFSVLYGAIFYFVR
jgi:hypothetical protein